MIIGGRQLFQINYFRLKGAIIREIEVINPGTATIQGNIGTCTHCNIDV